VHFDFEPTKTPLARGLTRFSKYLQRFVKRKASRALIKSKLQKSRNLKALQITMGFRS